MIVRVWGIVNSTEVEFTPVPDHPGYWEGYAPKYRGYRKLKSGQKMTREPADIYNVRYRCITTYMRWLGWYYCPMWQNSYSYMM